MTRGREARTTGGEGGVTWRSPLLWGWLAVWALTRAYTLARLGTWDVSGTIDYQDVGLYSTWAGHIAQLGTLPGGPAWQYPPGAAFLLLVPRLSPAGYGTGFVALMLAFDAAALICIYRFGRRSGSYTGVWIWLLGVPLLGLLPVLRFDLVPTVLTIAALTLLHRRPGWFGGLAGAAFALKIWPLVALFGEWDRTTLRRSALCFLAVAALVSLAAALAFGDPLGFVSAQDGRGLQNEAVAAIPWQLRAVVRGIPVPEELRSGSWEVVGGGADTVATALGFVSLLVLLAAAGFWWARGRAISRGREDLADADLGRDFVFAIVLVLVVVSRVLSPQYMLWLLGTAALVLSAPRSRLRRSAWIVLGAVAISYGLVEREAVATLLIRNVALLVAAADACRTLWLVLRRDPAEATSGPPLAHPSPE